MYPGTCMLARPAFETEWREQLRALRHLPAETEFPRPNDPELVELLDELLGLPDDADPLAWLTEHRSELAARVELREQLDFIRAFPLGIGRTRALGRPSPEPLLTFLGELIHLPDQAEPFRLLHS